MTPAGAEVIDLSSATVLPGFIEAHDHITFQGREAAIVDSPDEARIKVREHWRRGATVIKIMPSGGVGSIGDDPHHMTMIFEEMKAVIDTAHELGLKVSAHAHGKKAIDTASVPASIPSSTARSSATRGSS